MAIPEGMEGFAFLWKEEKPKKENGKTVSGGNPPKEEREAAFQKIIDEDFKKLYFGKWRKT